MNNQRKVVTEKKAKKMKLLALLMSFFLIGMLIINAPAKAFVLNLTLDKTSVYVGDNVVFTASVNINSNENLPVEKLVLQLFNSDTSETTLCMFDVNGNVISGCDGISIVRTNGGNSYYGYEYGNYNGYGYNFGYGYGYEDSLKYEINLNTDNFDIGEYSTKLSAYIGGKVFSQDGEILTINAKSTSHNNGGGGTLRFSAEDVICLNAWQCTEWSKCNDGWQTRTCGQTRSECMLSPKPVQERECAIQLQANIVNNGYDNLKVNSGDNGNNFSETSTSDNLSQNSLAGITGAVVGAAGGVRMLVVIIFLCLLIALCLSIIILKLIFNARRARAIRRLNQIRYRPARA